jgi:hypothetical protein
MHDRQCAIDDTPKDAVKSFDAKTDMAQNDLLERPRVQQGHVPRASTVSAGLEDRRHERRGLGRLLLNFNAAGRGPAEFQQNRIQIASRFRVVPD